MVPYRHDVRQQLRRVPLVGEPVPHRHSSELGQPFDVALGETSELDAVEHPPKHPSGVFRRLFVAHLGLAWTEVGDVGALVVGAHLEG